MNRRNEWSALAARLCLVNRSKHDELLEAMRAIVEAQEAGEQEMPVRLRWRFFVGGAA